MEIRGEQLSADSGVPSQLWESKLPQHPRSPSLGPFLRSQGHLFWDSSTAEGPRSLVKKLGLEGGREEPLTVASCLAASRWPSHPTQRIQSLGHPDFQFPPGVKFPLCLQSWVPSGPQSLPVPEINSVPYWASHQADGGRVTSKHSPWTDNPHWGGSPKSWWPLLQPGSVSLKLVPAHLMTRMPWVNSCPCTLVLCS